MKDTKTELKIADEDYHDIVINDKLLLHVRVSEGNISIDMYKHPNGEDEEDFLDGIWYSPNDLD